METFATYALPILLGLILLRMLLRPVKWCFRVCAHMGCGFLCLWLLNSVSGFTGIHLPVNAATVFLSGSFGMPGIMLILLLECL